MNINGKNITAAEIIAKLNACLDNASLRYFPNCAILPDVAGNFIVCGMSWKTPKVSIITIFGNN